MAEITAILVSYRRPENMGRLVDALRAQTVVPELILVNNWDMQTWGIGRAVFVPWNAGPMMRYLLAPYVETPWVMTIDDDVMPGDAEFVADALALAKRRPGTITSAAGRGLHREPPYYRGEPWGNAEIVLAKLTVFHRDLLRRVGLPPMWEPAMFRSDDIWFSLEVGRGQPVHWADEGLSSRLIALPEGGPDVALSLQPEHLAGRNAACRWWLEHRQ